MSWIIVAFIVGLIIGFIAGVIFVNVQVANVFGRHFGW